MKKCKAELERIVKNNNRLSVEEIMKSMLKLRTPKKDLAFWPNAMSIRALLLIDSGNVCALKTIAKWRRNDFRIDKYDDILLAYYLVSKVKILNKKQSETLFETIKKSLNKYYGKMIPYRQSSERVIYIDLMGMVPQMLIYIGINENDENLIDWGILQFDQYLRYATDEKTGLPYHAYNIETGEKLGIIGWGRAIGWIMTGLSDSILELGDSFPGKKNHLIGIYLKLLNAIEKYQREDGGFSWRLQAIKGHLDTSATGMILQSLLELKNERDILSKNVARAKKMMKCLESNYSDGRIMNCSAECGGIGIYPQRYDSYAWSVAPYVVCKKLIEEIPEMQ